MIVQTKQALGCWLHERWRAECAISPLLAGLTGIQWVDLCNRHERLVRGSEEQARICLWPDSSWLTVARVFPRVGGRLLGQCLRQWPVRLAAAVDLVPSTEPDISVVLPVSGMERLAQFRAVLAALASQVGVTFEIVVVEEGESPLLSHELPAGVRHVFLPRAPEAPYCKSRMLNAGAAVARGRHLLLHDADVLVPLRYLAEVCRCLDGQWEAIRPIRFLFCLNEDASRQVRIGRPLEPCRDVTDVMQNFPGGSVALRRAAYAQIGGMDERFKDWGGEDLEFLDRLNARHAYQGALLPAVHLWHPPARQKKSGERNAALTERLRREHVGVRGVRPERTS